MILRKRKRRDADPAPGSGDGFGSGDVRVIGPAERTDGAVDPTDELDEPDDPGRDDAAPDDVVLDELSSAFGVERSAGDDDPTEPTDRGRVRNTIAIGGDDELPDAVYLDDELGADLGSDPDGGPVFIDDDGRGDAIQAQDAGSGMDSRLRQRRIGVRRAEGRRRLVKVLIVLGVVVVLIAGLALLGSSLFSVDEVSVSGRRYADEDAVQAVVDDLEGTPVLLVDTDAAEDELEQIPWVAEARVRTDFPNSATIELRERVPLATIRGSDDRYRVIDREGRVLAIETGIPIAMALITGPGTVDQVEGEFADVGYAAAASLVTKLSPDVRSRLVSMQVTADGSDLVLVLRRTLPTGEEGAPIEVRFGEALGENAQIEKLVRLERLLDDIDTSPTTVIDVSTEETTQR